MAKRSKPIDFNISQPPRAVTDPDRAEKEEAGIGHDAEYPKHLALPDLDGPGGPAHREVIIATDAAGEKRARALGYLTHHEADVAERKAKGDAPPARKAKGTAVPIA